MPDLTPSDLSSDRLPSEVYSFVDSFPDWMQNAVCAIANGQVMSEEAEEANVRAHEGESLKRGQHPFFAVSSGSHPAGHEKFFVGEALVGQTLALRMPSAVWLDAEGKLTPAAASFLALVKSKHIDHLIHVKSSASELIGITYDYYMHGDKRTSHLPAVLRDFAAGRKRIYEMVREKGLKPYQELGIKFDGMDDEEKTKLAMAVQQALWDYHAAPKNEQTPEVVLVVQDEVNGRHYVWNAKEETFVAVPVLEGAPDEISKAALTFIGNLPQDEAWEFIAHDLMTGATEYEKTRKEAAEISDLPKATNIVSFSGCSDSRMPPKIILGRSVSRQRYVLRTPGAFWADKDGQLSYETNLFLALAAKNRRIVAHGHHSTCGAMGAVNQYCADPAVAGKILPLAFQDMGEFRQELFDEVRSKDDTEEAVVAFYKEKTGVTIESVADCLGLQQALNDYKAAEEAAIKAAEEAKKEAKAASEAGKEYVLKDLPIPPIVLVYQNMTEGLTYIFHPEKKKFLPVPRLDHSPANASTPTEKAKGSLRWRRGPRLMDHRRSLWSVYQRHHNNG